MSAVAQRDKFTDIGVMPEDWELFVLGDIAITSSGTTPARNLADRYYRNGTTHWVKTLDLNNSEIKFTDELVTLAAVQETSLRTYPIGTVLVAMYGGFNQIGRTGLLRIPAAVNQAITAIQPRASKLDSEYLLATLNFRVGYWKEVASSSRKDPNITSQDVRAFPISIPSLPEQRAIAGALLDVDALLAKLDALVAKKRDLKQAAMQQLLTGQTRLPSFSGEWVVKRFGDTLKVRHGRNQHEVAVAGGIYPILASGGEIGRTNTPLYDKESVLIGRKGTIDRPQYKNSPFWTVDTLFYTEILSQASPKFIYYKFLMIDWRSYNEASGVPSLNASTIENIEVLMPALAEQIAIAAVLSDMDAELTALKARRDKTRALKQGMMQELLTGRIRLV